MFVVACGVVRYVKESSIIFGERNTIIITSAHESLHHTLS